MPGARLRRRAGRSVRGRSGALGLAVALLACGSAGAQVPEISFSSPPNRVGSGARATAVGSAFVAVADDATAASWNPAGLIQLERPELSVVGLATHQVDDFGTLAETTESLETTTRVGRDATTAVALNYASFVWPFAWRGRNLVVSLNYQQKLGFDRELDFSVTSLPRDQAQLTIESTRRFEEHGRVYALSPAVAVEVTPELSLGATLSYWFDGIGRDRAWRREETSVTLRGIAGSTDRIERRVRSTFENLRGVNGTFGVLWSPHPRLALGSFVELPFTAKLTLEAEIRSDRSSDGAEPERTVVDDRAALEMSLPLSYGFGLSWRPIDPLTLSADVTRVEWNQFRVADEAGNEYRVTGDRVGEDEDARVDAVTTARLGAEYLLFLEDAILALRGGAFYDPDPARGAPQSFYGGSLGGGLSFEDLSVDVAYQLRFALDARDLGVTENVLAIRGAEVDVYQHLFYLSLVYYL